MQLSKEQTLEIVKKFGGSENNTGSASVQIALLTARTENLKGHFVAHEKDYTSNRGLLKMIGQRKSLLKYLSRDQEKYNYVLKELNLRK